MEQPQSNPEVPMDTESPLQLNDVKRRIEAIDADLSGSTFEEVAFTGATWNDVSMICATISNANLTGLRIINANLTGASLEDCAANGMTINGIAVSDLLAAYRLAGNADK